MRTGPPTRDLIIEDIVARTGIDEAMIDRLVRTFYGRARLDALIGPIFENKVHDWDKHLGRMCAFWSSVALMSGRYHGQPMVAHLPLPIDTPHFDRWLEIFAQAVHDVCPPAAAAHFLERRATDRREPGVGHYSSQGADQAQADRVCEPGLRRRQGCALSATPHDRTDKVTHPRATAMTNRVDNDLPAEGSSPACAMHQADDVYMGYAGKDEVIAFLNELLEAERAGARVTLDSARAAGSSPIGQLMRAIHRDEERWCAMLLRHLKVFGSEPSSKVGAFYGKAMAIADLHERVAFLNRGQGWVVQKLREMLPRVRDDRLHADLTDMLRSHEANIALATDVAGRAP